MSENKTEMIFVDGAWVNLPSEKAKAFIIVNIDFKVAEFTAWLKANENSEGKCKTTVKLSAKTQKPYWVLNNYNHEIKASERKEIEAVKTAHGATPLNTPDTDDIVYPADEISPENIPF